MNRKEENVVAAKKPSPVVELQEMTDALEGRLKDSAKKTVQWTAEFAASGAAKGGGGGSVASIEP